jgi:hypothetical protein
VGLVVCLREIKIPYQVSTGRKCVEECLQNVDIDEMVKLKCSLNVAQLGSTGLI